MYIVLSLALTATMPLAGQVVVIYPEFGAAFGPTGGASGYALGLNFQLQLSPRQAIGIDVGHLFTDGRGALPKGFEQGPYYIRTPGNPNPLNLGGGWFFSPLSLGSRPNRYFTFNLALKQLYKVMEKGRHTLYIAGGLAMAYRDETEVVRVASLNGEDASVIGGLFLTEPVELPVYRYASYLDLGLLGEAGYRKSFGEKLFLHANTKLLHYPSSKGWMLAIMAGAGVRL